MVLHAKTNIFFPDIYILKPLELSLGYKKYNLNEIDYLHRI